MLLCTICARGGSKGVPNKNIRPLLGRPLLAYTIEQALRSKAIDHVVVSTDSNDIARVATECGVTELLMRPEELARDDTPKLPVIQHAVRWWMKQTGGASPDYVIDMDPTSPLRIEQDIVECLSALKDSQYDSVITGYRSNKNPYFNMIEIDPDGYAGVSKKPGKSIAGRQLAPVVYAMNASIYVWRTEKLFSQESVTSGRVKLVVMPEERSIDIDSETDFLLVKLLMKARAKDDLSK